MYLGQLMYLHTSNMEELLNNLLFIVKDRLTPEERYMIVRQYNQIKCKELLNEKQQEKELKEQITSIINEINNSIK